MIPKSGSGCQQGGTDRGALNQQNMVHFCILFMTDFQKEQTQLLRLPDPSIKITARVELRTKVRNDVILQGDQEICWQDIDGIIIVVNLFL